jgi:hypothetical protein
MKLPVIQGIIRRRILVNYRADPDTIRSILPKGFGPKLHNGNAVAGICLIRLEHIRPLHTPEFLGLASENAAHRIAVEWDDGGEQREGVYIPRRDSNSLMNRLAGGRVFPGEHNEASFHVVEDGNKIRFTMNSADDEVFVRIHGEIADRLPASSMFSSLNEASGFFEGGAVGYSVTKAGTELDGINLHIKNWRVEPLSVDSVQSSFYDNHAMFPAGSVEFDHALIMRNVEHEWHSEASYKVR